MPKETIYSDVPGDNVEIGWSRDEYVQIGVHLSQPDSDGNIRAGNYTTLSRHGINKLIRTLRRARDQAYGADE